MCEDEYGCCECECNAHECEVEDEKGVPVELSSEDAKVVVVRSDGGVDRSGSRCLLDLRQRRRVILHVIFYY